MRRPQVLQLLVSGHTPAQIALTLHLTERSIRRHLEMLRRKFHAQTLMQVLAKAVALGMARPDLNALVD
jgi:DNA-binding CsgD family transcriptional regulator